MTRFLLTIAVLSAGVMPASVASEAAAEHPRTDRYGDPLPKAAIARLGTLRMRGYWAGPLVFSPDGKYLVAAEAEGDKEVTFWDIGTGRRVKMFTAKGSVVRLVFSPDGKQLAAAVDRGCLGSVWDVPTGKQRFTFTGDDIAFSADGKKLIAARFIDSTNTIRSYDTSDGKQQTEWSLYKTSATYTLSPDGRFVATLNIGDDQNVDDRNIHVYDWRKKTEVKQLRFDSGTWGFHFSRDGRRLVANGWHGWAAWDWETDKPPRIGNGVVVIVSAFSPDGRRLAWIGREDRNAACSLWVVDLEGGRPRSLGVTNVAVCSHFPAFSDDGEKLAVVTRGCTIAIVDSRTGRDVLPLDAHTERVRNAAYFSDNRYLVTGDSFRLLVWEAATGKLLRRWPDDMPKDEVVLLNTASHGRMVTAELPDGILRLRDLATGKELRRLQGKEGFVSDAPWNVDVSAVSADDTLAAILGPHGVRIYDLKNGDLRCLFAPPKRGIRAMNFSADGRTLEVAIRDYEKDPLSLYHDTRTGRPIEATVAPCPRKDPDGHWYESAAEAKARLQRLKLLDATGRLAFADRYTRISNVYESSDGRYLVIEEGMPDFIDFKYPLRVWDTATRRLLAEIDGQRDAHEMAGFSPDGRTFVSNTSSPATIYLWESATGRERLRLSSGHIARPTKLCFRPDGRVLVSGGADTQVFLWDITGRAPDGVACQARHSLEQMRQLWKALAGDDAAAAYRAIWALVDAPTQTVAWMREHLPPVTAVEPRRLARLIADLDSDEFSVRSKATEELEHLGESAEPALRGALASRPTLECRRRCEDLLAKLSVLSGERLRAVRAVEVLEHLGTVEARKLLEQYGRGAAEARLTQEARAARKRLAVRPAAP